MHHNSCQNWTTTLQLLCSVQGIGHDTDTASLVAGFITHIPLRAREVYTS